MRRRQDKPTVRLETVPTMQEIARQWHAALNESPAASADVDGYRDNGLRAGTSLPQEG